MLASFNVYFKTSANTEKSRWRLNHIVKDISAFPPENKKDTGPHKKYGLTIFAVTIFQHIMKVWPLAGGFFAWRSFNYFPNLRAHLRWSQNICLHELTLQCAQHNCICTAAKGCLRSQNGPRKMNFYKVTFISVSFWAAERNKVNFFNK